MAKTQKSSKAKVPAKANKTIKKPVKKTADLTQTLTRICAGINKSPKPALNKKHIRLYNHNLCPFAARGRYALSAKGIKFQDCLVCTHHKASWHLKFNGGMVPVMELPTGALINESDIVAQFGIEKNYCKGIELIPKNPVVAA